MQRFNQSASLDVLCNVVTLKGQCAFLGLSFVQHFNPSASLDFLCNVITRKGQSASLDFLCNVITRKGQSASLGLSIVGRFKH